ncbi:MAG: putative 2-dehydropantoate 2-reductase [Planctomycetes bacterium]|jgi:2-dehydropantoate 2-reductase|nr:putative 2-dehydropantoate 2-reductase [Planctomycetota bacterium]
MSQQTYAVIGGGAIGGYYGGCLARVGQAVHFLFRTRGEAEHVRTHGLHIDSPRGGFLLSEAPAYHDVRDMPRSDVVIVALKTTQNHLLPNLLPPIVKPGGSVLMLQNGLGAETQAANAVGEAVTILGGLCFVCIHKQGPGHIEHKDYGLVTVGEYRADGQPAGNTGAVQQVLDDFVPTKIPFEAAPDLTLARWKKLVWNVPFNGLCVAEQTTTDELVCSPEHLAHVEALMREVQAGCEAVTGRAIDEAHVQKMLDNTRRMTPYKPSMMLDFEAGRPMEVEAIFGEPVRQAEAAGAAVPRMRALYEHLTKLR